MNYSLLFFIFGTCTVILSIITISVGPITNKIIGNSWGYLNCELISDQIKLLNVMSKHWCSLHFFKQP